MIAIIPAAGKGARMASVTGGAPKELLEVGGKSLLIRAIDEARQAGAERVFVVGSSHKPQIEAAVKGQAEVVMQESPDGHAAAVALVTAQGPALILNPDTIFLGKGPSVELALSIKAGVDIALAVEQVGVERVGNYGIVEWNATTGSIGRIIEKPAPGVTESRWAIAGRFGISERMRGSVWRRTADEAVPFDSSLTTFLAAALLEGFTGTAIPLGPGETRLDCGSPQGYANAIEVLGG